MRLTASSVLVSTVLVVLASATPTTTYAQTPTPSAPVAQQTSTPAGLPAAPSETALLGGAELFWKDNSNNETGFRIALRVNGSPDHIATYDAPANATSFLLPADAPHVCEKNGGPALFGTVAAISAAGESAPDHFGLFAVCGDAPAPTSTVRVSGTPAPRQSDTPVTVPAAPSSLLLLGGTQLLWRDNSNNETGFRITISLSGASVGRQATYDVPANITSMLLPPDAPHVCEQAGDFFGINFSVTAFNAAGSSEIARSGIIAECGGPAIAPTTVVGLPNTGAGASSVRPDAAAAWLVVVASCLVVVTLSAIRGLSLRR